MNFLTGIFFIMHGLVHLLYMGHSLNYFDLEKDFVWPDNSWLLKNVFSRHSNKIFAAGLCIVAALNFILSGILALTGHSFLYQSIIIAVILSTVLYIIFWDGSISKLHTQGGIGILINILILLYLYTIKPV